MGPAPPPTGNLSELSPLRLYCLVASGERTALLTFQLADRAIEVRFRKGNPEHVSSSHPEDSIPEFLKARKLLDDAQLKQAEAALGQFDNDLVSALFGLRLLDPVSALGNLSDRALSVLLKAIVAQAGTFTYDDSDRAPLEVMPLGNRWAVLTALLRRIPLSEIKRRLAQCLDSPLAKAEGWVALGELPLTPQEARAVHHLNGNDSLGELARKFPQDSDNLHRLVFMLRELELVSIAPAGLAVSARPDPTAIQAQPAASAPPTPRGLARPPGLGPPVLTPSRGSAALRAEPKANAAANTPPRLTPSKGIAPAPAGLPRPPAGAAQAEGPPRLTPSKGTASRPAPSSSPSGATAAPAAAAELESLRALAQRFKDDNYFQVLGLAPKADAAAVKAAYLKLAKLYHPDTLSAAAAPEVARLKEEVFSAIGHAYRVLSDDRSRANYAEILEGGEADQEMLPLSQVLVAEEKFERGRNLVRAKRFQEAVKVLDEAISGSEEVAEFYAWRGYAKFFALEDKKKAQTEANRDLQLALRKSQHCASAHYFLGQIAKLTGDTRTALAQFRKAVELKPDHIDAKREVRLLTKK